MNGAGKPRIRLRFTLAGTLRAALAFWFAVLGLGVPLPAPRPDVVSSQPYPCMDHRCGCRDAEHCWRACCCMSREQKFAWAVEHGVRPPPEFFDGRPPPALVAKHPAPKPQAAKPRSCCAPRQLSCCEQTSSRREGSERPCCDKSQSKSQPSGQTSLVDALGCQGHHAFMALAVVPGLSPAAHVLATCVDEFNAPLAGERSPTLESMRYSPPVPPPRLG